MDRIEENSREHDQMLLAALLEGGADRERAWQRFCARFERLIASCIYKTLRRYGASYSADDLNDLVCEVWLRLLRNEMAALRRFDGARGASLASYLGLIATNVTIDFLRGRREQTDVTSVTLVVDAEGDGIVDRTERSALARRALSRLSDEEREFVVECFHTERSPKELARTFGISIDTVYTRKFKLRAKLQRIIEDLQGGGTAVAAA